MESDWTEEKAKIKKAFDWNYELCDEVIYSIIQDEKYVDKLFVSRNISNYLYSIFSNPTRKKLKISIENAKKIFQNIWDEHFENITRIKKRDAYEKKYKSYFQNNEKKGIKCRSLSEINPDDFTEVYLDNISTTKIRPEVQKVIIDYTNGKYGYANPSSITVQGEYAADLIKNEKKKIASILNSDYEEIYFTSCGSEGNNLAIKGIAFQNLQNRGHIISSQVEHSSVLETLKFLEKIGFEVTYLKPDKYGYIDAVSVKKAIKKNTFLISVMAANNEIGTLYPIEEIGVICKEHNIPFMVDGVQAYTKIPIDVKKMNINCFTFSGHKINGPKGIGGIYIKKNTKITPIIHGGGQEFGVRSGTENVGYILGLGKASEIAYSEMEETNKKMYYLSNKLLDGIKQIKKDVIIFSPEKRLNNLICVGFKNLYTNSLIRSLNRIGISISSGSACSSKKIGASHVIKAIDADFENIAIIRFGLGYDTDEKDIDYVLKYLSLI